MVPYLMRDYDHAYKVWNGDVGKQLDEMIQKKYGLKILLFYDYGFKNFWNSKRAITKPDETKERAAATKKVCAARGRYEWAGGTLRKAR